MAVDPGVAAQELVAWRIQPDLANGQFWPGLDERMDSGVDHEGAALSIYARDDEVLALAALGERDFKVYNDNSERVAAMPLSGDRARRRRRRASPSPLPPLPVQIGEYILGIAQRLGNRPDVDDLVLVGGLPGGVMTLRREPDKAETTVFAQ